jgi:hypothetical protein
MSEKTLKDILDAENDSEIEDIERNLEEVDHLDAIKPDDEDDGEKEVLCDECDDMRIEVQCRDCQESFCGGCFQLIHQGGKRKEHNSVKLNQNNGNGSQDEPIKDEVVEDNEDSEDVPESKQEPSINDRLVQAIKRQVEYIPLRLTYEERHLLHLLEAALSVSQYTDKVDILSYSSKAKRIVSQLKEMCSVLAGLVVASNLKVGQKLIENKNFEDNAEWYQSIFEIGRRYKIMNPDRMRENFGKLCYMIMDSKLPEIEGHMGFNLYKPINTVQAFLSSKPEDKGKALGLFDDELIIYATAEISPVGKSRIQVQRDIKLKESSIEKLSTKYSSSKGFSKEDIRQVLYSIGDYNAYTHTNRKPILRFIQRLEDFQDPVIKSKFNLGIKYGRSGSRLTHDHDRQLQYVHQSLSLWSLIQREMIHLWSIADDDLFNGVPYRLTSTGQGLNRVKACPSLYKEMYKIISECKSRSSSWIGSSVVHLGDDAVPNALFFLDKYIQVPNILIPIDQCLLKIPELEKDPFTKQYIENQFGSAANLQLTILQDAYAHMFDGSGADDFYMSGSCIDGRLTSAWNHTNQIAKKPYYKVFLLTGFVGFNGSDGF